MYIYINLHIYFLYGILDTKIVHTSGKQIDFVGVYFFDFGSRKIFLTYVPI